MKAETKQKLIKFNESKQWETTDESLMETITDYGSEVWQGKMDRHRWYTMFPLVVRIGDMFLKYDCCDVHGEESSVEDCIGGYKLDDVVEVFPVSVVITEYKTKEQIEKGAENEETN